ncbi:MAG TPA: hypothetical protein VNS88_18130 [Nitrospiraceae bacterium]|nr:hypothetical protein [Nitrospiraceae bacterium]
MRSWSVYWAKPAHPGRFSDTAVSAGLGFMTPGMWPGVFGEKGLFMNDLTGTVPN